MIDLKSRRVLCFFAHPDDETLAAGATIARLVSKGTQVHVAIPATGVHSRRNTLTKPKRDLCLKRLQQDCVRALSCLGVPKKNITLGDFKDNEMDTYSRLTIIHWLEAIIKIIKPDTILTHHHACANIDHRLCHEAAVIATRPTPRQHITLLCGEVSGSTGRLKPSQWEPNLYVKITEKELQKKIMAMNAYSGEARKDPHPRSQEVLRALAKLRGSESGHDYAEAFMIQQMYAPGG
ncbi:MAG: PIG-L family deacetylase [Deltaproteobacteria bacterium]|nr:PIG-L family deacetylase [Deltaproteobacteria bacterium]